MLILLMAPVLAFAADNVPDGYVVQRLDPLGGELLRPKEWHFRTAKTSDAFVYQISKEQPSAQPFETGLTINVVPEIAKKTKTASSDYLKRVLDQKKTQAQVVQVDPERDEGRFRRFAFTIDETLTIGNKTQPYRVSYTSYADDKKDLLFLFIFGSPKEHWETNQKIYDTMTAGMTLYDPAKSKLKEKVK